MLHRASALALLFFGLFDFDLLVIVFNIGSERQGPYKKGNQTTTPGMRIIIQKERKETR